MSRGWRSDPAAASSAASRRSRSMSWRRYSGSRANSTAALPHSRLSMAGSPDTNRPASIELLMPVWPVAFTPSPMVRWLPTPTWPARITSSPIVVLPAMPTCEASSVLSPMLTPWAICTRLSILAPARIRVSPTAGRSMVVLAPISTSSSITTGPTCGIFSWVPSARCAKPKPSAPMTAPSWTTTRAPRRHASRIDTRAWITAVGAEHGVVADDHVRVQHAAGADAGATADHDQRADGDAGLEHGVGGDDRARVDAGRQRSRRREGLGGAGERQVRIGDAQHRARRRRRVGIEDHGRGPGRRPAAAAYFGIGDEGDVARAGLLDAGHAGHLDGAIAVEHGPEPLGQLPQGHASEPIMRREGPAARRTTPDAAVRAARPRRARAARARRRASVSATRSSLTIGLDDTCQVTPFRPCAAPRHASRCPTVVKVK